jgi:hypothetical protein
MRTLSESLNGQNCAINNKRKIDEKQQEEIDSLKADVASINGDIESINAELENETVNKTTGNFSNAVSSPTMTTNDLTATNATIVNGEIAHIDATDIDADVADIGRLEATSSVTTNATVTNATINTADISTANITDANVTNWSIENFTAEDATVDDLVVNNSVSADVANIPTVNATDIDTVTLDATTVNGTAVNATDLTATYGNVSTLENQILKNEFITHEDYYIDVNQVLSDTDFVVIELPKIQSGDYRVTYKQLVDGYPALTQFSLTLNETDDNQWFSYSRAPNQKYMDEIAIKDGKLYIKTWFTGRLYFHSDTLANVTSPKIYSDWPIDTTDLDYPLFSASRAKATVYTHYVNLGMDADSYGSAVLTINPTSNYEDCATQAETAPEIQYDPNTDKQIYLYVPNQDVNKEADVEFENAKINDTLTIPENAAIDIEDMADNQYITKRDGTTAYRDIADGQIDNQPLSRLEDDLVTERKIANWNGATNRPYIPGSELASFTAVFSERDINDPEEYGTKSATSLSNIYKLTSNGNETYYKEIQNAQVSAQLEANEPIARADFEAFITNTPANYSYHLDSEVDDIKYYTLLNTSGTVAFAYDDGVYIYGTNYVGQATDSVFESLGLTKSTDYDSIVSSEWNTSDLVVDIVYVVNIAYDYLDKYWGVNNVFPKGTGQNIDGALSSSSVSEIGATFYYNEAEYTVTSHNYIGPLSQNCQIDANGNVTPNQVIRNAWNYRRTFVTLGPNTDDTYTVGNSFSYMPNDSSPSQGYVDMPDQMFTNPAVPAGVIDDSQFSYNGESDRAGYVMYHEDATPSLTGTAEVYDRNNNLILTNSFTNGRPQCKLTDYYRSGFIGDNYDLDIITDGMDYPLTVNEVGQTVKYVYYMTDGSGNYKYVHIDYRDDASYASRDWNWEGWSSTNDINVVLPTTWSYTRHLNVNSDLQVVGYIEQANTDIKFTGNICRQACVRTNRYLNDSYVTTASDWTVYWIAPLSEGNYFQDDGAIGNKYILTYETSLLPNPLKYGNTYNGGRINFGNYDTLVMFRTNQIKVSTATLDYDLIERTVSPAQQVQYSSSITHVGKITEGEWDAGQIVAPKVTTDELTADEITIDNDLTVTGNASIGGNLNVTGTIITVHSEEITTEENTIKLRDGAQAAIQPGEMSGIIIENYDGQGNDSEIALDSNGTLRIGDTNDTEPVATRDEAANFTNGNYVAWDATNSRLVDSGTAPTDLREWASIVGFDEYEDKTGDTSYTGIDDILTTLGTYAVSKGITSVLFEAPITSQTEFDLLNLSPSWLASGYLTGTLKILGGNVTFISKDNNIGWRYNGSTWSSLDVKTHAQIKLNYTGDWSTQTAAQKMDDGYAYNPDTEAAYVTGDSTGKYAVIAPTEMIVKNATGYNDSYTFKGGYKFNDALILPIGLSSIYGGTIPNGAIWIN